MPHRSFLAFYFLQSVIERNRKLRGAEAPYTRSIFSTMGWLITRQRRLFPFSQTFKHTYETPPRNRPSFTRRRVGVDT